MSEVPLYKSRDPPRTLSVPLQKKDVTVGKGFRKLLRIVPATQEQSPTGKEALLWMVAGTWV